jgi:hypothetical protein
MRRAQERGRARIRIGARVDRGRHAEKRAWRSFRAPSSFSAQTVAVAPPGGEGNPRGAAGVGGAPLVAAALSPALFARVVGFLECHSLADVHRVACALRLFTELGGGDYLRTLRALMAAFPPANRRNCAGGEPHGTVSALLEHAGETHFESNGT